MDKVMVYYYKYAVLPIIALYCIYGDRASS